MRAVLPAARNNNFTLLRLLLAALVLLSHAPELADGNRSRELLTRGFHTVSFGELAVDGFFLLSGYLVVQSWERDPNFLHFAAKRGRRIYPGFLVACLLSVLVVAPLAVPHVATYFGSLPYRALLVSTLRLQEPAVPLAFAGTPYPQVNGALWTIAYEARCYAAVALLGLLGPRLRQGAWLVGTLVFGSLLPYNELLAHLSFPGLHVLIGRPEAFFRLFAFFCVGACFYLFRTAFVLRGWWAAAAGLGLLGLLFRPALASLALATLGAYALFWLVFAPLRGVGGLKRIDDISYGLYLYGWPIQKLLNWYFSGSSPWLLLPVVLALASLAGYTSWHLVERPWLRKSPTPLPGGVASPAGAR